MNRLINIGFSSVGVWRLFEDKIVYSLNSKHTSRNVLYCFVSNGDIKYIGKTSMQLSQRMYGYQNPGSTQSTNIRINSAIKKLLENEQPVDILILTGNELLNYGSFKINLAAGLEDSLIFDINPEWNLVGKKVFIPDENSERPELTDAPKQITELIPVLLKFEITLGEAYYNQGFFNISQEYSDLIGPDNTSIDLDLGKDAEDTIQGYINRTANKNGSPRIMGGKNLRTWIHRNFSLGEILEVGIISPIAIRLSPSTRPD